MTYEVQFKTNAGDWQQWGHYSTRGTAESAKKRLDDGDAVLLGYVATRLIERS